MRNAHWSCKDRRGLPSHLAKASSFRGVLHDRRSLWLAGHPALGDLLAAGAADDVVYSLDGETIDPTAATVQRAAGDLPRLEEQVRRTALAVLPSVVAVKVPLRSHWGAEELRLGGDHHRRWDRVVAGARQPLEVRRGTDDSSGIRRLAHRATGRRSFSTTAVSVLPNCWARIARMMSLSCGCSSLVRIRTCPSAPRLRSRWATGFSRSVTRSDTEKAAPLPCGSAV